MYYVTLLFVEGRVSIDTYNHIYICICTYAHTSGHLNLISMTVSLYTTVTLES